MRGLGELGGPHGTPSCPTDPALLLCSLTGGPWAPRAGWPQWAGRQTRTPGPPRTAGECGPGWDPPWTPPPWTPSAPGWGCSWGAGGGEGVSLPSPPPRLQGDPGKQGDPGRDVSTCVGGRFGLCSCWGHHACKGPMSLVWGTVPCPQQSVTVLVMLPELAGGGGCPVALCSPISFPLRVCLGCVGTRDRLALWVPWDHLVSP